MENGEAKSHCSGLSGLCLYYGWGADGGRNVLVKGRVLKLVIEG